MPDPTPIVEPPPPPVNDRPTISSRSLESGYVSSAGEPRSLAPPVREAPSYTPPPSLPSPMPAQDAPALSTPIQDVPPPAYTPEPMNSVEVYDYGQESNAYNERPLPNDVYNNAEPLNVYEAYERSQNSFYAP